MRLRNGKKTEENPINVLLSIKSTDMKNYRRPRQCVIPAFMKSFTMFVDRHKDYAFRYENFMWQSCDTLLEDITQILDVSVYHTLSLPQHCDRLHTCFNILTKLQVSTSQNLTRIGKKIKLTDLHLTKLHKLFRYLKSSKDDNYKREWSKYNDTLCENFKHLHGINKQNYHELKIAYKYCDLTSRTSSIVSSAATGLHQRYLQHFENQNGLTAPKKSSPEYNRRMKIIYDSLEEFKPEVAPLNDATSSKMTLLFRNDQKEEKTDTATATVILADSNAVTANSTSYLDDRCSICLVELATPERNINNIPSKKSSSVDEHIISPTSLSSSIKSSTQTNKRTIGSSPLTTRSSRSSKRALSTEINNTLDAGLTDNADNDAEAKPKSKMAEPFTKANALAASVTKCTVETQTSPDLTPCRLTRCLHKFHADCIKDWLIIKLTCPVCRVSLEPVDQKKSTGTGPVNQQSSNTSTHPNTSHSQTQTLDQDFETSSSSNRVSSMEYNTAVAPMITSLGSSTSSETMTEGNHQDRDPQRVPSSPVSGLQTNIYTIREDSNSLLITDISPVLTSPDSNNLQPATNSIIIASTNSHVNIEIGSNIVHINELNENIFQ